MNPADEMNAAREPRAAAGVSRDPRLDRLLDRLPQRVGSGARWLRRPSSRWLRIPAGVLLIVGSVLSILPLFGLWMLPLGLVLLSEDVPSLRRLRRRVLDWLERRWPDWFRSEREPRAAPDPRDGS